MFYLLEHRIRTLNIIERVTGFDFRIATSTEIHIYVCQSFFRLYFSGMDVENDAFSLTFWT